MRWFWTMPFMCLLLTTWTWRCFLWFKFYGCCYRWVDAQMAGHSNLERALVAWGSRVFMLQDLIPNRWPILKPVNRPRSRSRIYEVPEWINFLWSAHEVLARPTVASCSVYQCCSYVYLFHIVCALIRKLEKLGVCVCVCVLVGAEAEM